VRANEAGEHLLFSFLTTESYDVVRLIHAKAMPVMLTESEEWEAWLPPGRPCWH
jgi:putative SOS response-associated peptidase YedK